jgi:hypothetical protein
MTLVAAEFRINLVKFFIYLPDGHYYKQQTNFDFENGLQCRYVQLHRATAGKPATTGKPATRGMPAAVRTQGPAGKPATSSEPAVRYSRDEDATKQEGWQQREGW